jgi:hypothetical protein
MKRDLYLRERASLSLKALFKRMSLLKPMLKNVPPNHIFLKSLLLNNSLFKSQFL